MNWVDLTLILVVLVSALLAFARGFVREVLGISSWAIAGVFAIWAFPAMHQVFKSWIPEADVADIASFGAVFVVTLFFLTILSGVAGRIVQASLLSGVDRTFGLVFGLVRGALVLVAAYILGGLAVPLDRWPDAVQEALLLPLVYRGSVVAVKILPEGFRPVVNIPPGAHETPAEELLRLLPQGRAVVRP